ncbi:MAG: ATPase [Nitrospirae bacterium]|nr:ATPase [Nitrospirota bacterium]
MSKVEIVGPRDLLRDVITCLWDLGVFQIEPELTGFVEKGDEAYIKHYLPDREMLSERSFLEDLRIKVDVFFSYLPKITFRTSYIDPFSVLDTIAKTIDGHTARCMELCEKKSALEKEKAELDRYRILLDGLVSLLGTTEETPDLDFIGLTIKEPDMVERIRQLLSEMTDRKFELLTEAAEDGSLVGLIIIEKSMTEKARQYLSDKQLPELTFPPDFKDLNFTEKSRHVKQRLSLISAEIEGISGELERFALRWAPIYSRVKEGLEERLSLLRITASAFETRMCFFIYGWMPSAELAKVRKNVAETFGGQVTVVEKEILEEQMDMVPIVLKNPPYFKPFELLVRYLPLPKYSSFDPTPFIGIFFPIFFGMILGDTGYGLILLCLSVIMTKRFRRKKELADVFKILFISSLYSIFFGILYGEFFGDLGHRLFGLEPVCIERRDAIAPMVLFSLSVGVAHVLLGLSLGFIAAIRKGSRREAFYKLLMILVSIGIIVSIASSFGMLPGLLARPTVIVIIVLTPFLLFTGGLLAPLELLKSIGNMISYVRIMAIGLTSVLLAFTANRIAGMTGDIITGLIIASLLHLLNLILGVFSPTIHSLRLHYVEFFSKFLEHGGRKFEPLKK